MQNRYLMRNWFLPFILLITFSCNNSRNELYLLFDEVDGMNTGVPIYINGLVIGRVSNIELTINYRPVITLDFNSGIEIPVDSEILLDSDLLGNSSIQINPGLKKDFYSR